MQFVLFLLVATFFDDEVGSEEGWRGPRQLTRPDGFSWDEQGLRVSHNRQRSLRSAVPALWAFMVVISLSFIYQTTNIRVISKNNQKKRYNRMKSKDAKHIRTLDLLSRYFKGSRLYESEILYDLFGTFINMAPPQACLI